MEALSIPGKDLVPIIKEALESGNDFKLLVTGDSMTPFIINNRDSVLLTAVSNIGIKKGVIVLSRRDNGNYVLHRVIKKLPDNRFLINGDFQLWTESIRNDQVIACVKKIFRKNRIIHYDDKIYILLSRIWIILRPLRPYIFKLLGKINALRKNRITR